MHDARDQCGRATPPQGAARGLWHGLNQVKFSSPRARVRRSGDV